MRALKTILQAILYVLLAIGLQLFLIYFLRIRIEGWGIKLLNFSIKMYLVPLSLLLVNSFLYVRTRRINYHITWFLLTVLPSSLLILFSKAIQRSGEYEQAVVEIKFFPEYQVEMLILLPFSIFIFQFILILYYLIKVRKEDVNLK